MGKGLYLFNVIDVFTDPFIFFEKIEGAVRSTEHHDDNVGEGLVHLLGAAVFWIECIRPTWIVNIIQLAIVDSIVQESVLLGLVIMLQQLVSQRRETILVIVDYSLSIV